MNLSNEFQPIRDWAEERGIYCSGDVKSQAIKLSEEMGELAQAVLKNEPEALADAIGDCTVVLVNLAKLAGIPFEKAVNDAYKVIAERKGSMINGTFVKQGQLFDPANQ